MISAKDEFIIEREMMQELVALAYQSGLSSEEMEHFFAGLEGITEEKYVELQKNLLARQLNPLERIKNGETLKASEINQAVKRAANNDE